jgi:type IX secretion system PorP/SprF family membrane protein
MNRRSIKNGLYSLAFVLMAGNAVAQDLHFSQFYNAPLTTNPANTGFIPDGDYRLGGTYRTQWASIPVPYKTMSFFGDFQITPERITNGWIGVGGFLLKDEAGTAALQSIKAYGSVAYHQMLGENSLLSLGFSGGLVNKRINTAKLTFDNQWNGKFFDVAAPTGETFAANNINYFDLHAGVNYAIYPSEDSYINFGAAVQHINRPKESFFDGVIADSLRYDNRLARRYTGFFNGSFKVNDQVIVNPQAYYTNMAKASEIVLGANVQYNLSAEPGGSTQIIGGLYARLNDGKNNLPDAVIPMLGVQYKTLKITFTYDATISQLNNFNQFRGGPELSIIHQGILNKYNGRKDTRCRLPAF